MMRTVDSVDEAIAFLEHYRGDHGAMYHHARLMLAGAREGRISVAEARQAFSAFARRQQRSRRECRSLMACSSR